MLSGHGSAVRGLCPAQNPSGSALAKSSTRAHQTSRYLDEALGHTCWKWMKTDETWIKWMKHLFWNQILLWKNWDMYILSLLSQKHFRVWWCFSFLGMVKRSCPSWSFLLSAHGGPTSMEPAKCYKWHRLNFRSLSGKNMKKCWKKCGTFCLKNPMDSPCTIFRDAWVYGFLLVVFVYLQTKCCFGGGLQFYWLWHDLFDSIFCVNFGLWPKKSNESHLHILL